MISLSPNFTYLGLDYFNNHLVLIIKLINTTSTLGFFVLLSTFTNVIKIQAKF